MDNSFAKLFMSQHIPWGLQSFRPFVILWRKERHRRQTAKGPRVDFRDSPLSIWQYFPKGLHKKWQFETLGSNLKSTVINWWGTEYVTSVFHILQGLLFENCFICMSVNYMYAYTIYIHPDIKGSSTVHTSQKLLGRTNKNFWFQGHKKNQSGITDSFRYSGMSQSE